MSKAKKPEPQPWLKYIVLPLLLILFGLLVSVVVLPKPVIAPSDGLLTPTPTPSKCTQDENSCNPTSCSYDPKKCKTYVCPPNGWVNCMPILTSEAARNCTKEALNWFKNNCPDFQGTAY